MGKKIDIKKTKQSGPDTDQYGDGGNFTHYLGNDENQPVGMAPSEIDGSTAYGNLTEEKSMTENKKNKKVTKKALTGEVEILESFSDRLLLAHPRGVINPTLLDEDLKRAREFSKKAAGPWTYCTNTEDVRLVNPMNILFLKEIKKLKNLKEIVVFAPGFINRFLIRLISPIFKPDRIIKDEIEFKSFLRSV